MNSLKFVQLTVVALFLTTSLSAREWTDTSGQTLDAEFVRMTSDNQVVLNSSGTEYTFPVTRFSQADQDYLKSMNSSKPTTGSSTTTKPASKPSGRSSLKDRRDWTTQEGVTHGRATFIRMHEQFVIIKQGSRVKKLDFYELSDNDQEFLRLELDRLGRAAEIPDKIFSTYAPAALAAKQAAQGTSSGSSSSSSNSGTGYTRPPAYTPSTSRMNTPRYQPPPMVTSRPSTYSPPRYTPPTSSNASNSNSSSSSNSASRNSSPGSYTPPPRVNRPNNNQVASNNTSSNPNRSTSPNRTNRSASSFPGMQSYKYCTNCNKKVPDNFTAGQNCPHCNVYFATEEDEFGRTTKKVDGWNYNKMTSRGGSIAIIGAVIGAFVGLCRWMFSGR